MKSNIKELNFDNVDYLQKEINRIDSTFYLTALNLYIWKYYDLKVYFVINDSSIYIYSQNVFLKTLYIYKPILEINNQENIFDEYQKSIYIAKNFFNLDNNIFISTPDENDINFFNEAKIIEKFNVSYLYETNDLKFMFGKKMQKKRNHLNKFIKNFENTSVMVKYDRKYLNDVLEFCKNNSFDKEKNEYRNNEINSIKELLELNIQNSYGSILFNSNKIIGFTFGIINSNKYEIFIEKANIDFEGSYQYLLSKNLQLNNINTEFIDRQDDMNNPMLEKSKKSYKPTKIISLNFISFLYKN